MGKLTLEDLNSNMNKRFDAFDEKFKTIKTEILKDMKALLEPTESKVKRVDQKVKELQKVFVNKLCYIKRNNELIITGIPYKDNENLTKIFASIASIMGYTTKPSSMDYLVPDVDIFRIPGQDPKKRRIVVKFGSEVVKERFLHRSFKAAKKLILSAVGLKSNDRFYIQQNLTPTAQKLKLAALKAKKAEVICNVRIIDGDVYIQLDEKSKFTLVKSTNDIPEVPDVENDEDEDEEEINSANDSPEESN